MFDVVKPCNSCKSHVLKPKKNIKLDLDDLQHKLDKHQFKIKANTGILLSTEKECKVNIYLSGKIVIITKDEKLVMKLKNELSNILYPDTKT